MAELANNPKQVIGKRMVRKSTRVDLTPMVDLGFLLITFFVFTTTMTTANAMAMITPKDDKKVTDDICESCAITVLPAANNRLYYYEGSDNNAKYKTTTYGAQGLRKLLLKKKASVAGLNKDAILIIKPGTFSTFKNLIDIIDESNICMYKRYYLDKSTATDESMISR